MVTMRLDTEGRLKRLEVEPTELEKARLPSRGSPDWSALFRAAGLDMTRFVPVEPQWTPTVYADARAAWEGPHPERPGVTMRVEAAAYRGRPVGFRWIGPWTEPDRDIFDLRSASRQLADVIWNLTLLTLFLGGAWLARRNLRGGRGDRRGGARLAGAVIVCLLAAWALDAHHVPPEGEFNIFSNGVGNAILMGAFIWVMYLALEPFARRHWPHMLISWTRLLGGGYQDSLIGRDLLVGSSAAAVLAIVSGPLLTLIPATLGSPPPAPQAPLYAASLRDAIAWAACIPVLKLVWCLGAVFFLVFVKRIVRREWLAAVIVILLFSSSYLGSSWTGLIAGCFGMAILVFVAIRYGLLAALTMSVVDEALRVFVRTADPSAWYFSTGLVAIAVVLAMAYGGFRMTSGRRIAPAPAR
jgi:hypothetical protein